MPNDILPAFLLFNWNLTKIEKLVKTEPGVAIGWRNGNITCPGQVVPE